jgi:molybdopterin-guanine dinucleotide biosynthesis protein B
MGPEEIAAKHMADADIVICEGFKRSSLSKIEIFRTEAHAEPLLGGPEVDASTVRAMLTNDDTARPGVVSIHLAGAWLEELADFIEKEIMGRATY